ncbi:two-component system regulatory protein YycI [Enterococcus saccharolyticus]|uniref:two-component system regulatory protein YycI n=1 Tax=Enterococcus saccharolyticus TaxID=41997 RepID=UPI0039E0A37C
MDFKRIEWIFFLAFLGVNIFLISIYREARSEQNIVSRSNQKIPIEQRLASENIKSEGKFSKEKILGYYLSAKPTNMDEQMEKERANGTDSELVNGQTTTDGAVLNHVVNDGAYLRNNGRMTDTLQNYFERTNNLMFQKEYTYIPEWDRLDGDYIELFAAQTYEGIPINDTSSRLGITVRKEDDSLTVVSYTQTHVNHLTPLREAMTLYSEEDAVNTLYINNKIPSNATLKWQQLAYTLTLKVRGKNVYVPAWFVAIETPDETVQIERVNALTNRIITNTTVRIVENT